MAKEGRREGEIIEDDAVAFGNAKGLATEIAQTQRITNLPNPSRRPAGVRKGYYVRLFETHGLLQEFFDRYYPGESSTARDHWQTKYSNWLLEYESDLAKFSRTSRIRVETHVAPKQTEPVDNQLDEDINNVIDDPKIGATEKVAQILARVGQGDFRKRVLEQWGNCCAVTGSKTQGAIRASHIKHWSDCNPTNGERLSADNGLPLVASLDALFDRGLISFDAVGRMIVSPKLDIKEQQIFGLHEASLTKPPTEKMAVYLAYHREKYFQK